MTDFDKSEQKKTEYVLIDTLEGMSGHEHGQMLEIIRQRVTREIEKRPHMQLVNITPHSWSGGKGGHSGLHLLFEERDRRLDSIQEDIMEIRETIEKMRRSFGA